MIDLSDNDVAKVDNFPLLPHLHTLVLNNNSIQRLSPSLASSLPNLTHLVLTNNRLAHIADLHPLHSFPRLVHLSLRLCPVTSIADYRLRVLHVLPGLKTLDYCRVRQKERKESRDRFGVFVQKQAEEEARSSVSDRDGEKERAAAAPEGVKAGGGGMLQEQMKRLIAAIEAATSLEEISSLEQQLAALHQMQRGGLQT